jgi:hypothetical protein
MTLRINVGNPFVQFAAVFQLALVPPTQVVDVDGVACSFDAVAKIIAKAAAPMVDVRRLRCRFDARGHATKNRETPVAKCWIERSSDGVFSGDIGKIALMFSYHGKKQWGVQP